MLTSKLILTTGYVYITITYLYHVKLVVNEVEYLSRLEYLALISGRSTYNNPWFGWINLYQ